mgnify:CR=1 FL=1
MNTIETTGAGDTFNGVLAAELALGAELSRAAERAVVAAGISVTRPFAATAVPYGSEVVLYLDEAMEEEYI